MYVPYCTLVKASRPDISIQSKMLVLLLSILLEKDKRFCSQQYMSTAVNLTTFTSYHMWWCNKLVTSFERSFPEFSFFWSFLSQQCMYSTCNRFLWYNVNIDHCCLSSETDSCIIKYQHCGSPSS